MSSKLSERVAKSQIWSSDKDSGADFEIGLYETEFPANFIVVPGVGKPNFFEIEYDRFSSNPQYSNRDTEEYNFKSVCKWLTNAAEGLYDNWTVKAHAVTHTKNINPILGKQIQKFQYLDLVGEPGKQKWIDRETGKQVGPEQARFHDAINAMIHGHNVGVQVALNLRYNEYAHKVVETLHLGEGKALEAAKKAFANAKANQAIYKTTQTLVDNGVLEPVVKPQVMTFNTTQGEQVNLFETLEEGVSYQIYQDGNPALELLWTTDKDSFWFESWKNLFGVKGLTVDIAK